MLIPASLSDEGSSLGTTESEAAPEAARDEPSLMNENDDWGMVTTGGALIVPGEEDEAETADDNGLQLSMPGSLVSDVGSIEKIAFLSKNNKGDNPVEEAANTAAPPSDFEEKPDSTNKTARPPSDNMPGSIRNIKWPMVLVWIVSLLLGCTTFACLHHLQASRDYELRASASKLRIVYLENSLEELEKLANERMFNLVLEFDDLKVENEELKRENERMKREEQLRFDTCQERGEGTVLVDNCWLSAKANVQLGDCANDAKGAVKDFSTSLFEHLQESSAAFMAAQESSVDEVEDAVARMISKLGKLFHDATAKQSNQGETTESTDDNNNNNKGDFFSSKSWFNEFYEGMFAESEGKEEEESSSSSSSSSTDDEKTAEPKSDGLDEFVKGLSEMMTAGEAFMTKALERATDAMEMNQTELLEAAKQAFEEASLAQHLTAEKK